MKLLKKEEITEAENFTLREKSMSGLYLMENAAVKFVSKFVKKYSSENSIFIFCGQGNNGGDGFAIARLLHQRSFSVKVFVDLENDTYSQLAHDNFIRLKEIKEIQFHDYSEIENVDISKNDVIIDGIFGIGLNRKVVGKLAETILLLNKIAAIKISIDIPSGLFSDEMTPEDQIVFKADKTYSFQFWKKAFLYPETGKYCGKISILNIGILTKILENERSKNFIVDKVLIKSIYKKREDFSNKGNFGNSVIIAGSYGKIGAAVLATKAALRSGSGLTFTISPECGNIILQNSAPEAMFIKAGENFITRIDLPKNAVCGIGPGLGTESETEKVVLDFIKKQSQPIVIDADALNIISKNKETLKSIPENSILTPHPKEFERLFGKSENSFSRTDLAFKMSKKFKIIIILKDHHTQIITPKQEVFYNITGNSGMAKGGSGDTLTGILTALLSQKYDPVNAAIFGVWLHGKAGDFAAKKSSKESLLPSDLIEKIGKVFEYLNS